MKGKEDKQGTQPERRKPGRVIKPQPTLRGFDGWVVEELAQAQEVTLAEAAKWIINRWITDNPGFLESTFGIRRRKFNLTQPIPNIKDYRDDSESSETG